VRDGRRPQPVTGGQQTAVGKLTDAASVQSADFSSWPRAWSTG